MSDKIQRGKLSEFRPTPKNSNKHTAKGLKALANSMSSDGYVAPMTATADGEILDGNARLETAFEKFGDEAIIVRHDGKTPIVMVREDIPNADDPLARRIHYRANMVQWLDFELDPQVVMADIESGFDFEAIDVSLEELGEMLEGSVAELLGGGSREVEEVDAQPDRAAELQEKYGTAFNQIWQCGPHRIMCGDSRDLDSVRRLVDGEAMALYVTDPPYGVSYGDKNRHLSKYDKSRRILTDIEGDQAEGGIQEVAESLWRPAFANMFEVAKPGCVYYMTAPQGGDQMMMMMMMSEKWLVKHELIWVKDQMVFGRADYHYQHEPIIYGWKPGAGHYFVEDRTQVSIWNIPRPKASKDHPTEKPVELYARAIRNSSKKGEAVGDFFLGSGTALVACEQLGRKCLGIELTPGYLGVALERWADLTTRDPIRLSE